MIKQTPIIYKYVDSLIFSYDRAMQLDAVLKSFYSHCIDQEIVNITVLYRASNERHYLQYQELINNFPNVKFKLQSDFHYDVLKWAFVSFTQKTAGIYQKIIDFLLKTRGKKLFRVLVNRFMGPALLKLLPNKPERFLFFLVDDNIFINDFSMAAIINHLDDQPQALGFSLRLGKNTTYCYAHNSNQASPFFTSLSNNTLFFDWTNSEHDFNYPLEISSSVYRSTQLLPLLLRLFFDNPNSLEGALASQSHCFSKHFPFLLCFEYSVTFCNPINIVQKVTPNRAGSNKTYTSESLSHLFDSGMRININKYNGFVPNGCHQEVELFLE